eukprot:3373620-Ditylum_brightwellii.AAC.1
MGNQVGYREASNRFRNGRQRSLGQYNVPMLVWQKAGEPRALGAKKAAAPGLMTTVVHGLD